MQDNTELVIDHSSKSVDSATEIDISLDKDQNTTTSPGNHNPNEDTVIDVATDVAPPTLSTTEAITSNNEFYTEENSTAKPIDNSTSILAKPENYPLPTPEISQMSPPTPPSTD